MFESKDDPEDLKEEQNDQDSSEMPENQGKRPDLAERLKSEMRRISLQGRQTFGEGTAEANPFEFMSVYLCSIDTDHKFVLLVNLN